MPKPSLERQIENAKKLEVNPNYYPPELWKLINLRLRLSRLSIELSILEQQADSPQRNETFAYIKAKLEETEREFQQHKIDFPD